MLHQEKDKTLNHRPNSRTDFTSTKPTKFKFINLLQFINKTLYMKNNSDSNNEKQTLEKEENQISLFGNLIFDSSKNVYYYWLILISLSVLYNLLMIVGRATFWKLQNTWLGTWLILDYLCDLLYLLDMAVNARTAYLEQGLVIRDTKKLWLNYSRSLAFKMDICSILPTDLYLIFAGLHCDVYIPCAIIVRINRLLKIYRLVECFDKIETKTNYPNAFRICKMVFIILVVIHWNGCLYFYISYLIGFSSDKWVFNLDSNQTFSNQYIYCFYWSTLTLTAIGDVPTPVTDAEYLFVIGDFLIGVLIFATIVGNVGSIITNMNQSRAEFQAKMDSVKQYMKFRRISKHLEARVIKWFDYIWSSKQSLDEESVLSVLSDKLKTEIAIHLHLDTLKKVKLFQDCEKGLLEQLVLKLRLQVFSPGDYICRKGDIGSEMYIVKKGKLSVVSEDGLLVFANLSDGSVFGELSVLNIKGNKTGNRRTANVMSVGYSDLYCLYKQDLIQVLEEYPEAKTMLINRGKEILRKDGLLEENQLEDESHELNSMQNIKLKLNKLDSCIQNLLIEYLNTQSEFKKKLLDLEFKFNSLCNKRSNDLDELSIQTL